MKPLTLDVILTEFEKGLNEYVSRNIKECVKQSTLVKYNSRVWFNIWRQVAKNVKETDEAR